VTHGNNRRGHTECVRAGEAKIPAGRVSEDLSVSIQRGQVCLWDQVRSMTLATWQGARRERVTSG